MKNQNDTNPHKFHDYRIRQAIKSNVCIKTLAPMKDRFL